MKEDEEEENKYPPNIFIINTVVDATNAFISLQYLFSKRKGCKYQFKVF